MDYIERVCETLSHDDTNSDRCLYFKNGFSEVFDGISENRDEALKETRSHFQKEKELIDYIAASLGSLSLSLMDKNVSENTVLNKDFSASDWKLSCHLTNIINTLLSIKELCLSGFDTQARSLVRTLDERIYQMLILFSSKDDYDLWQKSEDSRQVHFELFSKKKSILKKIKNLDEKYLLSDKNNIIFSLRKEYEKYYSDCIHGANVSVIVGSLAYPFGDIENGPFISALFGRASSCSFQTLHHVIGQMAYFSHMLFAILSDIHSIQSAKNVEYIKFYCASQNDIMRFSAELLFGEDLSEFSESVKET